MIKALCLSYVLDALIDHVCVGFGLLDALMSVFNCIELKKCVYVLLLKDLPLPIIYNGLCSPKFKYKTRSQPLATCVGRCTRSLRRIQKLSVLAVGRDISTVMTWHLAVPRQQ